MPDSAGGVMLVLDEENFIFGKIDRRCVMNEHHVVSEGSFVVESTTAVFYFANVLISFEMIFLR